MFAGDSGSGKSYILSANIVKDCQAKGVYPILIDTENALDESWLHDLGVLTGEDDEHCLKVSGATIDTVTQSILLMIDDYLDMHGEKPYEERPKMLFIIDSLGMLISPNNIKQAEEANMVGDMGIKAKQITHMMRVVLAKIAAQPIGLAATNHVMDSQDKYLPDKIPGGKMLEFASSVIVQMNKYLLKEDEFGAKLTDGAVAGIRSTAVVRKSRYAKPFEKIKIDIPYDTGMNPYSGLFDLFEKKGVIQKSGARYTYTSPVTGEEKLEWRKNFRKEGILDQIMEEWEHWENPEEPVGVDIPLADEEEAA
jgi:RecA/RadA recombinase